MGKQNPQHKKISPRVRDGKVQEKNRHARTPTYWNTPQPVPVVDREPPGRGYKHYLRKKDILDFIELLPEWDTLSEGLNAIVLARGDGLSDGYCNPEAGVIEICAWERDRWAEFTPEAWREHRALLQRLGVESEDRKTYFLCKFNPESIRAYQLLHVLLHELGHHRDRMTTKKKQNAGRGERFAEEYAAKYEDLLWERYFERFGP